MADRRRQIGTFAVLALVLLRLAIGWHFYREGMTKVEYDVADDRYRVTFSAEPFLYQAKGRLAGWFHAQVSSVHDWRNRLAVARQNEPLTAEDVAKRAEWEATDTVRRKRQAAEKQPATVELPPFESDYDWARQIPYYDWARQIADDWQATLTAAKSAPGLTDAQLAAGEETFRVRKTELAAFLAGQSEAISEYQHELWRLDQWREMPEADGAPFHEERVAIKAAEVARMPFAWINQVRKFDQSYYQDLRQALTADEASAAAALAIDAALANPQESRLEQVNMAVAVLTIGVGVCLLVGFFTRLASLAGALFLLSVIVSQPPWVTGAEATYYQTAELASLLVLAGTGPGRWFGLDYFGYALCNKFCRRK